MSILPVLLVLIGACCIVAGIMLAPGQSVISVSVGREPTAYITVKDNSGRLRRFSSAPDGKGGFMLQDDPAP